MIWRSVVTSLWMVTFTLNWFIRAEFKKTASDLPINKYSLSQLRAAIFYCDVSVFFASLLFFNTILN